MGIRLKVLLTVFLLLGIYAFYYLALPIFIDLEKLNPFITNYIKKEYNYNVKIEKPDFKMALSPAIWLKADKFMVLNRDNSPAMVVDKPMVKVSLISIIFSKLNVKYFSSEKIFLDLYCDKSFRISLGQYLLNNDFDYKLDINGSKILIDKFFINFTDTVGNTKTVIDGKYLNIDRYDSKRELKASLDADIKTSNINSKVNFNINTKLPFNEHLDDYPPEVAISVTNFQLSEFSNFIKSFTNGDISYLSGLINMEIHSGKEIFEQKQYLSNIVVENLKCNSKYLQKPYLYAGKIQIDSSVLLEKSKLNIASVALKTSNFNMKLSGYIDKISSKKPIPNLNLKMLNARAEDILLLLPYCDKLNTLAKINISEIKDSNFHSDVNVNLNITDNLVEPLMFGNISVNNAYVFEPIKKAPKGADIGIEYKGDYLNLKVNVPTDKNQEVNVSGRINVYGEQECDLHITSTPLIDLALTKKVLMPVHKSFNFLIGPVPVMGFSGFGSIDLVVKGTRKDPHAFGWFKTLNAMTYFEDAPDFVLKNADALLTFDDFDTKFKLIQGNVNGKTVNIDGTCNLAGKFDFNVKTPKQELNYLLNVLKTSPMLDKLRDSVKMIDSASGLADFSMNLKGQLIDISEMDFGKNVHAVGKLSLLSDSIRLTGLKAPINNIFGNIDFNDLNFKLNLVSRLSNSKIFISGNVDNDRASVAFKSEKIKISDFIKSFDNTYFSVLNSSDADSSFAQFKGQYSGSISKFDISKVKLDGSAIFKNLNLVYKKTKMPIKLISGSLSIKDGNLNISSLNSNIGTMPAYFSGYVYNIFQKPKMNLNIKSRPNQKFADYVYNKNAVYPIKIKGDILLIGAISGFLDNLAVNSAININKGSSIYYMGAMIGDDSFPIILNSNSILKSNQLDINSFIYDKISFINNKSVKIRQLSANGQITYSKNDIYFRNFKVKTNVQTDLKIFNLIFKKPLIKKGIFTSDIIVNGAISNPVIRGTFNISDMDIPFFDANVNKLSLKFLDNKILADIRGDVLSNGFTLDVNAQNSFKPPYVINNAKLNIANFNVDHVLASLNEIDDAFSRETNVSTISDGIKIVDLNRIIIKNFDIISKKIHFNNISANDLSAKLSMKNGNMNVDKFAFKLANGYMDGSVGYNIHSNKSTFDLNVSSVDADNLLTSLFDVKGQMFGDLNGQITLSCVGLSQTDCLKTLDGNGAFLIKDGRMPKLGSLEYLLKAGNLIKSGITGLSINSVIDIITPLKTGNFDSIKGSINIKNGVADKINILSSGKDLSLYLTGDYNFSTHNASMYVFGRLSKNISTLLGPIGNLSLNTLFNAIPGVNLNSPENAPILNDINKIPMIELSSKAFRVFAAEIFGDIEGDDYVQSFRWIE